MAAGSGVLVAAVLLVVAGQSFWFLKPILITSWPTCLSFTFSVVLKMVTESPRYTVVIVEKVC